MSTFTDDELRQIYTFLPLDQEPKIKNINSYIRTIQRNLRQEDDKIDEDWRKWRQDVNYDQFCIQYNQLLQQLRDLIDDWRLMTSKMVALNETNLMIPTNYEEIERYVLNSSDNWFNPSDEIAF